MLIANPIYDVVFKRLMENERAAKFFVGTLLDETIEHLQIKPQEFTYLKYLKAQNVNEEELREAVLQEHLNVHLFRLDFIATIKTESGEFKKILIEIQKAQRDVDLMRFRNYLGEQYRREEWIEGEKMPLPITTIYILGFKLPKIEAPCLKVARQYYDLVNKQPIYEKNDFIEKLSHDCYIVQVERITDRYQTKLDKLLSIFEQKYFIDDSKTVKNYTHLTDIEELQTITNILHHAGTDPEERQKLDNENEAMRTLNALFHNTEKQYKKTIQEQQKALSEQKKAFEEQQKAFEEQQRILAAKEQANADLLRQLEELKRKKGR